tara:strand:- start:57 stop:380 length:324 start_codon:yes stop_codon:yes gene_type:complete
MKSKTTIELTMEWPRTESCAGRTVVSQYTPTLEDAEEWASIKGDKGEWFCDLLGGISKDLLMNEDIKQAINVIRGEFIKLLGDAVAKELLGNVHNGPLVRIAGIAGA